MGDYYMRHDNYLITPFQKAKMREKLTVEDKARLIKDNLIQYGVVVGIVEKMSESLEVLQHLIDGK